MSFSQRSWNFRQKLIVDLFAGGGGASTGIFMATSRHPDIAINHDLEAIALHKANHPTTHHIVSDVFEVNPYLVAMGQPIGLLWASPDCKHFSKAKGGKPKDKKIRSLAWVVIKWAKAKRPHIIILENVEEFKDWCPLDKDGKAIESKKGSTFKRWKNELKRLGYEVDFKELRACDYGAPTTRKRLYLIARCDNQPIVFPKPTCKAYKSAASVIDFSLPCPSIFDTKETIREKYGLHVKRPLAEKTLKRIAKGIKKFIIDNPSPYIVKNQAFSIQSYYTEQKEETRGSQIDKPLHTITAGGQRHALVCATISKGYSTNNNTCVHPGQNIEDPLHTITTFNNLGVVTAYLDQHNLGNIGRDIKKPLSTVTTTGSQQQLVTAFLTEHANSSTQRNFNAKEPLRTQCAEVKGGHFACVQAFLTKFYGQGTGQCVKQPLHTVKTGQIFGLVTIKNVDYKIVDIGMRMLTPRELYSAQGFPKDYKIDIEIEKEIRGKKRKVKLSKTAQIRMCGNSVCPPVAAALVRANYVTCKEDEK